uniref:Putative neurexin iii-alpha n=1 Tax=Corethrella appendiculata TaxID=1370023 RepID=U5ENH4_9DIPT
MVQTKRIFIIVFLISLSFFEFLQIVNSCELETQTQHGCKIENGQCNCAFGCKSEFRYSNRKECTDALKGRSNDICSRAPCLNGGSCTQVTQMPQYKCRCEGTGYWGTRCQRSCPKQFDSQPIYKFPHECIVI